MIRDEVIWLTGASSGIGLALARKLAVDNKLIVTARNEEALQALARDYDKVAVLPLDLSREDSIAEASEQLRALCQPEGRLDRVILNAGTCHYLDPRQPDWSLVKELTRVNFFGLVNSLAICFELLQQAPRGHIVGISSQVVHAPFPRAEGYGASKAAVDYFLEALRMDVLQRGMDVTVIQPGFVDTPLTRRNRFPMPFLMSAERAAARIYHAVARRKMRYAFPRRLLLLLKITQCFPGLWLKLNHDRSVGGPQDQSGAGKPQ